MRQNRTMLVLFLLGLTVVAGCETPVNNQPPLAQEPSVARFESGTRVGNAVLLDGKLVATVLHLFVKEKMAEAVVGGKKMSLEVLARGDSADIPSQDWVIFQAEADGSDFPDQVSAVDFELPLKPGDAVLIVGYRWGGMIKVPAVVAVAPSGAHTREIYLTSLDPKRKTREDMEGFSGSAVVIRKNGLSVVAAIFRGHRGIRDPETGKPTIEWFTAVRPPLKLTRQ